MNNSVNVQTADGNKVVRDRISINWQYVLQGLVTALAFLAMVAFWATFAYSMWSGNVDLAMTFGKIIAVMVGVVVPVMILQKLYQRIAKI